MRNAGHAGKIDRAWRAVACPFLASFMLSAVSSLLWAFAKLLVK